TPDDSTLDPLKQGSDGDRSCQATLGQSSFQESSPGREEPVLVNYAAEHAAQGPVGAVHDGHVPPEHGGYVSMALDLTSRFADVRPRNPHGRHRLAVLLQVRLLDRAAITAHHP